MNNNSAAPAVSIILPCRNEVEYIDTCLRCILDQENLPDDMQFEVIVADGMSDDGTREIIRKLADGDSRLRMIDNPKRITPTALNLAIEAARGEIIVRMDAHNKYAPDYVRECVIAIRETGADNVGGPARAVSNGTKSHRAICAAYHCPFSSGGASFHDPDYEGYVDTIFFGCWKKETLINLGMFDEELVRNQDDELNFRIIQGGGRLWQTPKIKTWYSPRSTLATVFRQYAQYGYWKVRVIQKRKRPAKPRHLVPVFFVMGLAFGWIPGLFHWSLLIPYVAGVVLYLTVSVAFSVRVARTAGWDLLPLLPPVFFAHHAGYGIGFTKGIIDFAIMRREASAGMTTLTRPASGVAEENSGEDNRNQTDTETE